MNFSITVEGTHKAQVTILPDGNGAFSGRVVSPEYGTSDIREGTMVGNVLKGVVELEGVDADINAVITGQTIAGTLKVWFADPIPFSGTEVSQ
jgi:hypothetical protein